jgi:hypothetical protein
MGAEFPLSTVEGHHREDAMPRKTVVTRLPLKANADVARLMDPRVRGATAEFTTHNDEAIPPYDRRRSATRGA